MSFDNQRKDFLPDAFFRTDRDCIAFVRRVWSEEFYKRPSDLSTANKRRQKSIEASLQPDNDLLFELLGNSCHSYGDDELPEELLHFRSFQTSKLMLPDRFDLWMGRTDDFNDKSEIVRSREIVRRLLSDQYLLESAYYKTTNFDFKFDRDRDRDISSFLQKTLNAFNSPSLEHTHYALCLSAPTSLRDIETEKGSKERTSFFEGDQLSLWRMYTDDGRGCAFILRSEVLLRMAHKLRSKPPIEGFEASADLGAVFYGEAAAYRALSSFICLALAQVTNHRQADLLDLLQGTPHSEEEVAEEAARLLHRLIPFLKHSAFMDEREARLTLSHPSNQQPSDDLFAKRPSYLSLRAVSKFAFGDGFNEPLCQSLIRGPGLDSTHKSALADLAADRWKIFDTRLSDVYRSKDRN